MELCKKWKLEPTIHPEKNTVLSEKEFKLFMKKCKTTKIKEEDCIFFDKTSINPLTGRKISSKKTIDKIKLKCKKLSPKTSICHEWNKNKKSSNSKGVINPRTGRRIKPNGKTYINLENECKSFKTTSWWTDLRGDDYVDNPDRILDNKFYEKYGDELKHKHSTMVIIHTFHKNNRIYENQNHEWDDDDYVIGSVFLGIMRLLELSGHLLSKGSFDVNEDNLGDLLQFSEDEEEISIQPEDIKVLKKIYLYMIKKITKIFEKTYNELIVDFKIVKKLEKQIKMFKEFMGKIKEKETTKELKNEHKKFISSFFKKNEIPKLSNIKYVDFVNLLK